jgi:hypothetical protein
MAHAYIFDRIVRRLGEWHAHWYRHERLINKNDVLSSLPSINDDAIIQWTLSRYITSLRTFTRIVYAVFIYLCMTEWIDMHGRC